MDLNKLNSAQRRLLQDAILSAFTRKDLDQALQLHNWEPLANFLDDGAFRDQVFDLVNWVQRRGRTLRLIEAVQAENPDNPLIRTLLSDLQVSDIPKEQQRTVLVGGSLERTVREKAGFAELGPWVAKLMAVKRQVCRVEDSNLPQKALGTGFLVTRDLVMTNYHVVENYIRNGADTAGLSCRFDYAVESGGTSPGIVKPVARGTEWPPVHARYSAFDTGDQGGLPGIDELDFALLRLTVPVGDDLIEGGGARGWVSVSRLPPQPVDHDICFIVQHPKGEPVKLAVGNFTASNANGSRIRYDANTGGGSSGSPCFDAKLDLVALHHGGDPDTGRLATFNQGIPIGKILDQLDARESVPRFWID